MAYANAGTLRQVAALASGSMLAMTFLLPLEHTDPEIRPALEMAEKGARASGTPFHSFFTPAEQHYFAGRGDGLRPPDKLVATTR
jgi:hypothetical protein